MKKLIIAPLWLEFCFYNEALYDYGIKKEQLFATARKHFSKAITYVTITIDGYVPGNALPPFCIRLAENVYGYEYAVYTESLNNIEQGLKTLDDTGNSPFDPRELTSPYIRGLNTVVNTPYMDNTGRTSKHKQKPQGYIPGFDYFVNRVIYKPSEEDVELFLDIPWVTEFMDEYETGGMIRAESKFTKLSHSIRKCFEQIQWITQQWSMRSNIPKINDIYVSFDLDLKTRKVRAGIDIAEPISSDREQFVIARAEIKPEDWLDAEELDTYVLGLAVFGKNSAEFTALRALDKQVRLLNEAIEKLDAAFADEGDVIKYLYDRMFKYAIHGPIIKAVHLLWGFSDLCDEGKVIVTEEINSIINTVFELNKTSAHPIYLDVTNILLHTVDEGNNGIRLPDEDQVILKRYQTFMASFGDAVQTALINSGSAYIKPMVEIKPVDDKSLTAVPTISAETLLARENELRK